MKRFKRFAIGATALLFLSSGIYAQFSFTSITNIFNSILPNIVYDPTVAAAIGTEILILNGIEDNATQIYNTAKTASQMIQNKNAWRYLVPGLNFPTSTNTFGTSSGWLQVINTGVGALGGYQMGTTRIQDPTGIYARLSTAGQINMANHFSTLEITDGLAQNTMTVTGATRASATAQNTTLANLQNDSLSNDPAMNTEVGVLNKINAATLVHAQTLQNTNQLLAAMADQQTVAMKLQRDVLADELNAANAAMIATPDNTNSLWGGANQAHGWRLP